MVLTGEFSGVGVRPTVLSATALSSTQVRVQFSEPMSDHANMTLVGPLGTYLITADGGSDGRVVTAVVHPSQASYVILTLGPGPLTPGTDNYRVSVENPVYDLVGNLIADPLDNGADFSGPALTSTALVPSTVMSDGGYLVTARHSSLADGEYYVTVGSTRAKSIELDKQGRVTVTNSNAQFVTPPLAPGSYLVTFTLAVGTAGQSPIAFTEDPLVVVQRDLKSGIYDFRRLHNPKLSTGPRLIALEPYPQ